MGHVTSICDRCNKETTRKETFPRRIRHGSVVGWRRVFFDRRDYDLCPGCVRKLQAWIVAGK